jgi:hypothetical protein
MMKIGQIRSSTVSRVSRVSLRDQSATGCAASAGDR